jgi:hypothetical protein
MQKESKGCKLKVSKLQMSFHELQSLQRGEEIEGSRTHKPQNEMEKMKINMA